MTKFGFDAEKARQEPAVIHVKVLCTAVGTTLIPEAQVTFDDVHLWYHHGVLRVMLYTYTYKSALRARKA